MKSFLVIAAIIITSFQNIAETTSCSVEHLRNFSHDYLHKSGQEINASQMEIKSFSSYSNGKDELEDQIHFTTDILQNHQFRAQLLAHFNIIMSKNLKMTQHEIMAGIKSNSASH